MQQTQAAAPVLPVSCPTYTPAAGAQTPPIPQQQAIQALVGVARNLEQAIPAYQLASSVAGELLSTQPAGALVEVESTVKALQEAIFHHQSALGAIRRFLAGETTPSVLSALAVSVHQLARVHQQLGPLLERLVMSSAPEQRTALTPLPQYLRNADTLMTQAAQVIQTGVGPQIWQAARSLVFGRAT